MIEVNQSRFDKVFSKIFEAYISKAGIFSIHTAENTAPQTLSKPNCTTFGEKDHLYWASLVVMSDTRTTSHTLYPRFAKMFTRNKKLFLPGYYPSAKKLHDLFRKYQIALPYYQVALFLTRKQHLDAFFEGNPLKVYEGVTNIDELFEKFARVKRAHGVQNLFPGAKRKVFTMLAQVLTEFVPTFTFKELVPVDVHVQNIANGTNSLIGDGVVDIVKIESLIRPYMAETFSSFKHHFGVASATWILGSRGCSNCHRTDMSSLCPVYGMCSGPTLAMRHHISGKLYGRLQRPIALKPKFIPITLVI